MKEFESTVDAVTRKEVQLKLPGSSMRNSKQKDDDCVSEDSFGSDFYNATDEEESFKLKARLGLDGADTELDSPPPIYSEEEQPQSMSLLANIDVKAPSIVLQYTPPTGSAELEPDVTPNLPQVPGPSMCVVRGLIFDPALISINC